MFSSGVDLPVCAALHEAAGSPPISTNQPPQTHRCGICHRTTLTHQAARVLSENFTAWDDIRPDNGTRYLCDACAWTYKTRPGLRFPLLVTNAPTSEQPTYQRLRDMLSHPIPASVALIVPVSGARTLAPLAQWGRLTFDGGTITWTPRHAMLLRTAVELCDLGAWERALNFPSPPVKMLDALPATQHAHVFALWRTFDEARYNATLAPLLLRLTRKDKTDE